MGYWLASAPLTQHIFLYLDPVPSSLLTMDLTEPYVGLESRSVSERVP